MCIFLFFFYYHAVVSFSPTLDRVLKVYWYIPNVIVDMKRSENYSDKEIDTNEHGYVELRYIFLHLSLKKDYGTTNRK